MVSFFFRKIWNTKWLMLCLLIGNILLIGIVSSAPMYQQATMQRIFLKNLEIYRQENEEHPAFAGERAIVNNTFRHYNRNNNRRNGFVFVRAAFANILFSRGSNDTVAYNI